MYVWDWKVPLKAKALNRMWDEIFDDYDVVRPRKCIPRLRREFIDKINQDPVMRYDWRYWNVGIFDAAAFAHMCDGLRIKFEVRRKDDDSIVSTGFSKSSPLRNVPLADFINSLDYVGLYATLDGVPIQNFDYCHHVDSRLGAKQ